ncbi:hypothetical protein LXA43DRAFT_1067727 [Ganoderma leucocontextum]|nr:hypothetical protein LXA43DRAFT_1067727 [Ganoderma leucocontextum]
MSGHTVSWLGSKDQHQQLRHIYRQPRKSPQHPNPSSHPFAQSSQFHHLFYQPASSLLCSSFALSAILAPHILRKMATLLSQLQSDRSKYQSVLVDIMTKKAKEEEGLQELQMATSLLTYLNSKVHALQDACYIAEQSSGSAAYWPSDLPMPRTSKKPFCEFRALYSMLISPRSVNTNKVHIADNVVEYWERRGEDSREEYTQIKPGLFTLTNFVEVQVSFMIVRIARQEYVFVPKLRALCLLDRVVEMDYNLSAIRCLASGQLSPLKKVKCKVGYRTLSSDESGNDNTTAQPPTKQLRRLALGESGPEVERVDVSMKEVAQ